MDRERTEIVASWQEKHRESERKYQKLLAVRSRENLKKNKVIQDLGNDVQGLHMQIKMLQERGNAMEREIKGQDISRRNMYTNLETFQQALHVERVKQEKFAKSMESYNAELALNEAEAERAKDLLRQERDTNTRAREALLKQLQLRSDKIGEVEGRLKQQEKLVTLIAQEKSSLLEAMRDLNEAKGKLREELCAYKETFAMRSGTYRILLFQGTVKMCVCAGVGDGIVVCVCLCVCSDSDFLFVLNCGNLYRAAAEWAEERRSWALEKEVWAQEKLQWQQERIMHGAMEEEVRKVQRASEMEVRRRIYFVVEYISSSNI